MGNNINKGTSKIVELSKKVGSSMESVDVAASSSLKSGVTNQGKVNPLLSADPKHVMKKETVELINKVIDSAPKTPVDPSTEIDLTEYSTYARMERLQKRKENNSSMDPNDFERFEGEAAIPTNPELASVHSEVVEETGASHEQIAVQKVIPSAPVDESIYGEEGRKLHEKNPVTIRHAEKLKDAITSEVEDTPGLRNRAIFNAFQKNPNLLNTPEALADSRTAQAAIRTLQLTGGLPPINLIEPYLVRQIDSGPSTSDDKTPSLSDNLSSTADSGASFEKIHKKEEEKPCVEYKFGEFTLPPMKDVILTQKHRNLLKEHAKLIELELFNKTEHLLAASPQMLLAAQNHISKITNPVEPPKPPEDSTDAEKEKFYLEQEALNAQKREEDVKQTRESALLPIDYSITTLKEINTQKNLILSDMMPPPLKELPTIKLDTIMGLPPLSADVIAALIPEDTTLDDLLLHHEPPFPLVDEKGNALVTWPFPAPENSVYDQLLLRHPDDELMLETFEFYDLYARRRSNPEYWTNERLAELYGTRPDWIEALFEYVAPPMFAEVEGTLYGVYDIRPEEEYGTDVLKLK